MFGCGSGFGEVGNVDGKMEFGMSLADYVTDMCDIQEDGMDTGLALGDATNLRCELKDRFSDSSNDANFILELQRGMSTAANGTNLICHSKNDANAMLGLNDRLDVSTNDTNLMLEQRKVRISDQTNDATLMLEFKNRMGDLRNGAKLMLELTDRLGDAANDSNVMLELKNRISESANDVNLMLELKDRLDVSTNDAHLMLESDNRLDVSTNDAHLMLESDNRLDVSTNDAHLMLESDNRLDVSTKGPTLMQELKDQIQDSTEDINLMLEFNDRIVDSTNYTNPIQELIDSTDSDPDPVTAKYNDIGNGEVVQCKHEMRRIKQSKRQPEDGKRTSAKSRKRRRADVPLEGAILPPCRVCGDVSSGYHYGANTCEACKGFFRRTMKGLKKPFRCKCTAKQKSERKQGHVTNTCSLCRYNRCVEIGMSKEAIKIGRYTSNHRTQNITEIKSRQAGLEDEHSDLSRDTDKGNADSPSDTIDLGSWLLPSENGVDFQSQVHIEKAEEPKGNSHPCLSMEEMDGIISQLHDAHQSTLHVHEVDGLSKETTHKNHQEYLEMYNLKKELFGNMKALSKDEYVDFYNATGIDIDGRHQSFRNFFYVIQNRIKGMIRFSKSIPGFKDLSQNDQINLIKHSRPEAFLIASYPQVCKNVNVELSVFTMPWNKVSHFEEGQNIFPVECVRVRAGYCRHLEQLGLTASEQAVLRGIVMTFTDRCELEDPVAVQNIQDKLMACLEHVVNKRAAGPRKMYYKLSDTLISLRNFTENGGSYIDNRIFEFDDQIDDQIDDHWINDKEDGIV